MAEFLSDTALLERFVSDREEAAFVALVQRHGPRVERICRRILRNEHDVEDVFQATFLVLARKADGITWRESVSPWIDGVARRLAMHARSGAGRQRSREVTVTTLADRSSDPTGRLPERFHPVVEPSAEVERSDLRRVLDDELLRLPEKYRAPVVLCDLEGHTREEAARQLGWPTGSMSRRLDRARSLLRHRLTHRGLALVVIGLVSLAIAAAVGLGINRGRPVSSVRPIMTRFLAPSDGGDGSGSVLAAAARSGDARPDFARILPAARAAASVARRIEGLGPGHSASLWYRFATEMSDSAADLERACEESDAVALVAAARRLDASCVNCHAVFRRGLVPADVTVSDRVSCRSGLADPPENAGPPLNPGREGTDQPSRALTARGCSREKVPPSGVALRSPRPSIATGLACLASNERMGTTVKIEGPERSRFIPGCASSNVRLCPHEASRRCCSRTRARPDRTPVC